MGAGFATYIFRNLPVTAQLHKTQNRRIYDLVLLLNHVLSPDVLITEDVVVVDIDEKSLGSLGQFSTWHSIYFADLVDSLAAGEPLAIGFDVFFAESDSFSLFARERLKAKMEEMDNLSDTEPFFAAMSTDAQLSKSIQQAGNVFLGMFYTDFDLVPKALPSTITSWELDYPKPEKVLNPVPPIPLLAESAYGVGFAHINSDEIGVVYEYPLFFEYQGKKYVNFSFQMMLDLLHIDKLETDKNSLYLFSGSELIRKLPLDQNGRYLFKYYDQDQSFRRISFSDVLTGLIPTEYYEGKIILVGTSAAGLYDQKVTPLYRNYPGVELHATFIANLINQDYVFSAGLWHQRILILSLLFLYLFLISRLNLIKSLFIFLGTLLVIGISFVLFYTLLSCTMDYMEIVVPWVLGFLSFSYVQYSQQLKEKKRIKNAFEHYVAKDVVNQVINDPEGLKISGSSETATVLFADIRGFTTLCEICSPQEIISFLHYYFNQATSVILKHKGMLDKYIGDAIVALFNVPIARSSFAVDACKAAIEVAQVVEKIRSEYKNDVHFGDFKANVGLATGCLMVGNMGSDVIFNYTAIGDKMNLASRLEGLNKYYHSRIIIDDDTYTLVKDEIFCRALDRVSVKGRDLPCDIYEVIDLQTNVPLDSPLRRGIDKYEKALIAIQNIQPEEAHRLLLEAEIILPEDQTIQVMKAELDSIEWDNWDGIRHHTDKNPDSMDIQNKCNTPDNP